MKGAKLKNVIRWIENDVLETPFTKLEVGWIELCPPKTYFLPTLTMWMKTANASNARMAVKASRQLMVTDKL